MLLKAKGAKMKHKTIIKSILLCLFIGFISGCSLSGPNVEIEVSDQYKDIEIVFSDLPVDEINYLVKCNVDGLPISPNYEYKKFYNVWEEVSSDNIQQIKNKAVSVRAGYDGKYVYFKYVYVSIEIELAKYAYELNVAGVNTEFLKMSVTSEEKNLIFQDVLEISMNSIEEKSDSDLLNTLDKYEDVLVDNELLHHDFLLQVLRLDTRWDYYQTQDGYHAYIVYSRNESQTHYHELSFDLDFDADLTKIALKDYQSDSCSPSTSNCQYYTPASTRTYTFEKEQPFPTNFNNAISLVKSFGTIWAELVHADSTLDGTAVRSLEIPNDILDIPDEYPYTFSYGDVKIVTFEEGTNIRILDGFEKSTIKEITIPASVEIISYDAFKDSKDLETVIFEEGSKLKEIKSDAFAGCSKLNNIVLPNGLEVISSQAFMDATSLEYIDIPSSVKTIESRAFKGCSALQQVNLYEGLTHISYNVFQDCTSLESIDIPSSVQSIEADAFRGASSLKHLYLKDDSRLEKINSNIINGTAIESFTVPNSVKEISTYGFNGATMLRDVEVKSNSVIMNVFSSGVSVTAGDTKAFEDTHEMLVIFVPDSKVSAYRGAVGWRKYSHRIFGVSLREEDGNLIEEKNPDNRYTITFNTDGGSTIQSIEQIAGQPIYPPLNPTKSGFSFEGWFSDPFYYQPFTFTIMPENNIVLYAKWQVIPSGGSFETAITLRTYDSVTVRGRYQDSVYYKFIPNTTGSYSIYTSGSALYYTRGFVYDSNYTLISSSGNSDFHFRMSVRLQQGQVYYIRVYMANSYTYNPSLSIMFVS